MADEETTKASSPKLYYIKEARAKAVPQDLSATQDLMTTFNLLPLYNHYVRQRLDSHDPVPPLEPTFSPYISDLPGKNVIRPGKYIAELLEAPDKSYGPIDKDIMVLSGFSLRPGRVVGFDSSVLGTDEDHPPRMPHKAPAPDAYRTAPAPTSGQYDPASQAGLPHDSTAQSHHHHHHHHHHSSSHHSHHGGSKSSTSSPHVDRIDRGEDGNREHRHKKKKKKRKHEYEHEHGHHEGDGDTEHRKKKKRKKEREEHGEVVVD